MCVTVSVCECVFECHILTSWLASEGHIYYFVFHLPQEKCVQYWPRDVGGVLSVKSSRTELRVTLETQESHSYWQHKTLTVKEVCC